MYFEIEDYRPDITPVGSVISWREGVLLSIIVHLVIAILALTAPRWMPERAQVVPRPVQAAPPEERDPPRFVFVQPRLDMPAPKPPPRPAPPSDLDREARSRERAPVPDNPEPLSQGNTRERVEAVDRQVARGTGPEPQAPAEQMPPAPPTPPEAERLPEAQAQLQLPTPRPQQPQSPPRPQEGGSLGNALRDLQRYVQRDQFSNPQGGGAFGPAIQFDTKGVEFGPWIRRFIAQVKRNWEPLIPLAAMSMRGHVVVTFNVHKNGSITDLQVVGPSGIAAFNTAAYGALASSNPTAALPPEYPADKAFFTVTFFYNEEPQ
jgi:TonB family protein